MHVDHVDSQHFYGDKWKKQPAETPTDKPPLLPDALNTEEAKLLLKKVQDAGYLDANYQPIVSRTQAAVLAYEIAKKLGIRNKWKPFEYLWNRKNIRSDYNKALSQQQFSDFIDELKALFC